ncbi:MAG TPA: glycoside hydrolase family 43 protein [Candidatus Enterococcus avicola]|uniref:Glycoside hydrolase family 43 protein n=1 Tax=Candidatus Enterococcus avicola TaxID=2838561 RepID=A0A9D2F8M6_9ENTE|nr:glycoside hydrolase family 43 protein [Candidatus Enterococcus avicola]
MKKKIFFTISIIGAFIFFSACNENQEPEVSITPPEFKNVAVHDPSFVQTEDSFYIIGSHLQAAKSEDLLKWELVSENVQNTPFFTDIRSEFKEEFEYAQTDTFWASDIIQLKDGRYYMYYCLCRGDSPLSVLGVAIADNIEGPYKKSETFLYSGTSPQFDQHYDATKHPNVIDPHVFYDDDGKLWMVYGSYSGGIFILEMDDTTGLPIDRNSYGKKLMGGNHSRIEGPYIIYNPTTEYYYLFVSFGGLDSVSGYNMRVSRSKNPDGPYEDIQQQPMEKAKGRVNTFFDDKSIEPYGNKVIGNFTYEKNDGMTHAGYVSPGHNSVYYEAEKDRYFLIFHTRFPNRGEQYGVRVHQMYFTKDGWPVVNPLRYSGEEVEEPLKKEVPGAYTVIETTKEITKSIEEPSLIELKANGNIKGDYVGKWQFNEKDKDAEIIIEGIKYKGRFVENWDERQAVKVMTFTGLSEEGIPIFIIETKENEND